MKYVHKVVLGEQDVVRVLILAVAILVFLEPDMTVFGKKGDAGGESRNSRQ